MIRKLTNLLVLIIPIVAVLCAALPSNLVHAQDDAKDWPMYNRDVIGTRHNRGETAIDKSNAGRLEEKWRFPAKGASPEIGVIHATPVVVNGYVYFGTATDPAFYKLAPGGKVGWSYRNPSRGPRRIQAEGQGSDPANPNARFQSPEGGIFASALITADAVFFADIDGWIYALDRASGSERWKLSTRAEGFPGFHPLNVLFASPIPAGGMVIFAGGALEQLFAGSPFYKGSTGRGFVIALEPKTGRIAWKHDIGPKPEPLDPPITIKDSWGEHVFYHGPATSSVWSTPSLDAESGTIF